jgi:tRNA pseudouridine38-40 synthase
VKVMRRADIRCFGDLMVFDFEASAFLHHMVRNLVGSLVAVGQGRHPPEWIAELLAAGDRRLAAPTFAAAGLYLVGVGYAARWGLPAADADLICRLWPIRAQLADENADQDLWADAHRGPAAGRAGRS